MKSWQLANGIIHDFYPSLIPGTSILVQQDFGSFYVYWIHLTTYRFQDYFVPSMTFRTVAASFSGMSNKCLSVF